MVRKIAYLTMMNATLLIFCSVAHAITWYGGTHVVQDVDAYGNVYVWNNAGVQITGGTIASLDVFTSSVVNMSGGAVLNGIAGWDTSSIAIAGGQVGWFLEGHNSSVINISGGQVSDYIYAVDSSKVNIYGYGFDYNPLAGVKNGGQLNGFWASGIPFTIDFLDNIELGSTYHDHVTLYQIPEPATLLLLGLGGLIVRKRIDEKIIEVVDHE